MYTSHRVIVGRQKISQQKTRLADWRNQLTAAIKADPVKFAILAAGVLLVLVAVGFYFSGFIRQNVSGEAFYDFQYPYRHTFSESWKVFFFDRIRSRLMHGVLVSALYHTFGFNPPAYYLSMLLLLIFTSVFIVFALRPFIKSPWIATLLIFVFTWLPLNIVDLSALKKLHHVFAWFAFWLAILLWQRWVDHRRFFWLAAATLAFLASILSYEVAIALLPVAVLLSIPKLKGRDDLLGNLGMALWISFLSGLAFLNLERIKPFSSAESVYATGGWDLNHLLQNALTFLPRLPAAIWNMALMENPAGILNLIAKTAIAIGFFAALVMLWDSFRRRQDVFSTKNLALVFVGLWLSVAAYLPFILAGQRPDSDGLRGATFGVVLLVLAGAIWMTEKGLIRLGNIALGGICLFWTVTGVTTYTQGVQASRQEDFRLQNVVLTLKAQVPDVAETINFIFVNSGLGRTGCIGFVNMLYDRSNLHCIHLLSADTQESYTRTGDGLQERGGRLWPERFIIVTLDAQGNVTLLDQLGSDDYSNLPITWESLEPLLTNRSLIYSTVTGSGRNFDFYNYMMAQRYRP